VLVDRTESSSHVEFGLHWDITVCLLYFVITREEDHALFGRQQCELVKTRAVKGGQVETCDLDTDRRCELSRQLTVAVVSRLINSPPQL